MNNEQLFKIMSKHEGDAWREEEIREEVVGGSEKGEGGKAKKREEP